jgi:hypothetical protein
LREKKSLLLQVARGGHGKDGAQVTGIFAKFAGPSDEPPLLWHSFSCYGSWRKFRYIS